MGKKPIVSVTYENERKVTIDARYAWEKNIYFFRSRWKLASLSSSKVIHFNFHYHG